MMHQTLSAPMLGFWLLVTASMTSLPTTTQAAPAQDTTRTYYWNHPKLGPVKVDRSTGFIVVPKGREVQQSDRASSPSRIEYWVDPKGNVRRIRAPGG